MYGHTSLLVAAMLLEEAASFIEEQPVPEANAAVCNLLVERAKELLG